VPDYSSISAPSLACAPLSGNQITFSFLVGGPVTFSAQCDQVYFSVTARLAAELPMMDLKLISAATVLASPSVSCKYLEAKGLVRLSV
jgi:hypothetical protein